MGDQLQTQGPRAWSWAQEARQNLAPRMDEAKEVISTYKRPGQRLQKTMENMGKSPFFNMFNG